MHHSPHPYHLCGSIGLQTRDFLFEPRRFAHFLSLCDIHFPSLCDVSFILMRCPSCPHATFQYGPYATSTLSSCDTSLPLCDELALHVICGVLTKAPSVKLVRRNPQQSSPRQSRAVSHTASTGLAKSRQTVVAHEDAPTLPIPPSKPANPCVNICIPGARGRGIRDVRQINEIDIPSSSGNEAGIVGGQPQAPRSIHGD